MSKPLVIKVNQEWFWTTEVAEALKPLSLRISVEIHVYYLGGGGVSLKDPMIVKKGKFYRHKEELEDRHE